MRVLRTLITNLGAFFISFITRPLLGGCLSRYWLHVLNRFLGCCLTVIIIMNISELSDEQISKYVLLATVLFYVIVKISEATPKGQEHLKLWYDEASEEDDKEYFSKRDMKGKPWWKFMFIPGWITIIVLNFFPLLMWLPFIDCRWQELVLLQIFSMIITIIVIRNAVIRKRNYDNGYK